MGPLQGSALILAVAAMPAAACSVPPDLASPLRGAVAAVKHLPRTEAWERALPAGTAAQYILHLDQPRRIDGRCYWTLDLRAGTTLWKRFLVTPGGGRAMEDRTGDAD